MDSGKKTIIIGEIEKWRQGKLLPEHYCDFLLHLYLEDGSSRNASSRAEASSKIRNSSGRIWLLIFGIIGLICYLGFYFSSFAQPLQIAVAAVAALVLYMAGAAQRVKRPWAAYLFLGLGSLVMLAGGLYFLSKGNASLITILLYAGICAILWMVTGVLARMAAFHFCGWAVLALIYSRLLKMTVPSLDWVGLQMSWLPICIVLTWAGWLLHHKNKPIGAVLLVVGLMMWFAPEIYGMAAAGLPRGPLQLSLFGKLAAAGAVLFASRKKWTEWLI